MEYDIYELMRGVQDDSVPLPEDGAAGLRRIKELTMNKIQENQGTRGVRPIRRMTRVMLAAVIAAGLAPAFRAGQPHPRPQRSAGGGL